jgi:hypothetical protein
MRHDGCGGHAGKAELLTGIDGVSSRPVRRIVLMGGWRHTSPVIEIKRGNERASGPPGRTVQAGCINITGPT